MKVLSLFPSNLHGHMYRGLISKFKFCLSSALLNYEMSSCSFEVSSKFFYKSYLNSQKQREFKFEKSVIFPRWIFSKRPFFLLCPDSWLHEIILFALILIEARWKKKPNTLWAKRLIMSQKKYQQLYWTTMNCFLTLRKVFFILPGTKTHWRRAEQSLAPQWTV